MTKVFNMFREFSMEVIEGYNDLSKEQKEMFDITYKRHLSSLHINERSNYLEYKIKHIDATTNVLKVSFENGERFVYSEDYTWIKVS